MKTGYEKVFVVKKFPKYEGFYCVGVTGGGVFLYTDDKNARLYTEEEVKNFLSSQSEKVKEIIKGTYQ